MYPAAPLHGILLIPAYPASSGAPHLEINENLASSSFPPFARCEELVKREQELTCEQSIPLQAR